MDVILDLFGDPVPANWGRRGRPQHIATHENRNKVKLLLALGWSTERIAQALSITTPTLRKNYFRELKFRDEARSKLDARLRELLWLECCKGNVAAIKEFRKLQERDDVIAGHAAFYAIGREQEDKQPKLGKKEQAELAAQTAGVDSDWGDDLRVPGAVVN
jgi:hypothetical protein